MTKTADTIVKKNEAAYLLAESNSAKAGQVFHNSLDGEDLDKILSQTFCHNCEQESARPENFCSHCGQKRMTQRASFGRLIKEAPEQFFQFDRGLLRTILHLFTRPGAMARDYVYGKRKRYINPLAYFLIGASIQLISVWFSSGPLRENLAKSVNVAMPNSSNLKKMFGDDPATVIGDIYLSAITQSYTYAAVLFLTIPLAFLLWTSHRLIGPKYNYGEVLVFAFYVTGHLLLMTAFITPIAIRVNMTATSAVGPVVYLGYILYAHGGFFKSGVIARIFSLGSMMISMLIFFGSIMMIFLASLLATIAFKSMLG
ncbi:MAG: DUF3667 domain-containing protein [Mariniblastus sp.]